jgi:dienelactone hydrolase
MSATESEIFQLEHPRDPKRIVRGRIEGPRGFESAREPLPHVLVLHGFKGFMDWGFFPELSRRIAARGMVAVRFNMSGSGIGPDLESLTDLEAFAHNTYTRELEDVELVRAWLRSHRWPSIDLDRAALFGHSRGGGVALLHAAERGDVRSIVTWSAIPDVDRFDEATKAEWRERGHLTIHNARTHQDLELALDALDDVERNRERLDIEAACRRITAPVLLIHGSADETVAVGALDRLRSAVDPKLVRTLVIEGAGHTFGVTHPMRSSTEPFERAVTATIEMFERHWS